MSSFIIPMSSLPSITSISEPKTSQPTQNQGNGNVPFADFLQKAMADTAQTGQTAQSTMLGLALGDTDDLHTGAISAVKSSTAINFTSSLVSTAIRSYNELMRMQV